MRPKPSRHYRGEKRLMISGLIDIHSHILPKLDDGCPDMETSLAAARSYVDSGFAAVVATPHHIHGSAWSAKPEQIQRLLLHLKEALGHHHIPLQLSSGMEIAISNQFWKNFEEEKYLPLGNSATYLLEFPFQSEGKQTIAEFAKIVSTIKEKRFLIAHPERCASFQENLNGLELLYNNGCLIQLNFGSMLGWYGTTSQKAAFAIIARGMCHIIASDCHGSSTRKVPTPAHLEKLGDTLGASTLKQAMLTNPAAVLQNRPVAPIRAIQKTSPESTGPEADDIEGSTSTRTTRFIKRIKKLFK